MPLDDHSYFLIWQTLPSGQPGRGPLQERVERCRIFENWFAYHVGPRNMALDFEQNIGRKATNGTWRFLAARRIIYITIV
jgi:hypothetical protein